MSGNAGILPAISCRAGLGPTSSFDFSPNGTIVVIFALHQGLTPVG